MKLKKGFTLAEVLITLAIIGVVAVLTLPGLLANTQEQQARAALKKMTNTFSNAATMTSAVEGYDYRSIGNESDENDIERPGTLLHMFLERCAVDRSLGYTDVQTNFTTEATDMLEVYLRDGTSVIFPKGLPNATPSSKSATTGAWGLADDGIMRGIFVIFDTNGRKLPNVVSNCQGTVTGVTRWEEDDTGNVVGEGDEATTTLNKCDTKSNRIIRDQFMMKLRNDIVAPLGNASAWMLKEEVTNADLSTYGAENAEEGEG